MASFAANADAIYDSSEEFNHLLRRVLYAIARYAGCDDVHLALANTRKQKVLVLGIGRSGRRRGRLSTHRLSGFGAKSEKKRLPVGPAVC